MTVSLQAPFVGSDNGHISIDFHCAARALFSTRRGGVSRGSYAELNLAPYVGDDPAAVEENWTIFARLLGLPVEKLLFGKQVHGKAVGCVAQPLTTVISGSEQWPEVDGHVTSVPGLAPTVLTADCLPVVLACEGAVAVLHAGWRGIAAGILEQGVREIETLVGRRELEAAVGPGAGVCCYEVGSEVFRALDRPEPTDRKAKIDLRSTVKQRLGLLGVACIHDLNLCTICSDRELFFSYRRDGAITGRQATAAFLL